MIYYFTGTGNSLYAAQKLAELTGMEIVSIAEIMQGKPMPETNEVSGIVFPIYAWAPPAIVLDFLKKHPLKSDYVFAVCTCGGMAGKGMRMLEKALPKAPDSSYSIIMPENYIELYDLDSKEIEAKILAAAEARIAAIAEQINARKRGIYDVCEGKAARLKSGILSAAFNAFGKNAKRFRVEDSCIACGRCAEVCPTRNIRIEDKPQWGGDCTLCLACIHHCPAQAIQMGEHSKKRGRYTNPNCRVEYHFQSNDGE